MPQYHKTKIDRFKVETKLKFPLRKWFPYFVGNKITFRIKIEDTEQRIDSTVLYIFQAFGDRQETIHKIEAGKLPNTWVTIIGSPIDREGDVIYKMGVSPSAKNSNTLFSAHVINTDRWLLGCVGLVAGAVVTIASGIALGFIKIEPILRIFITP